MDPLCELPEPLMRRLWQEMAGIFGTRWSSNYGIDPTGEAGRVWARRLAGLTPKQLADGVRACHVRGDEWPPSETQFRSDCLGVPQLAAVAAEFNAAFQGDGKTRSPFTMAVWQRIDGWAYRHADDRRAREMLAAAYAAVREDVLSGAELPPPAPAIEAPAPAKFRPADPAVAKHHIGQIAISLGLAHGAASPLASAVDVSDCPQCS